MPDNTVNLIRKSVFALGGLALVAALALTSVNVATAERIQEQQLAAERRTLSAVFPEQQHDNDLLEDSLPLSPAMTDFLQVELLGLTSEKTAYIAKTGGRFAGIILPVEVHGGYSGDIHLLAGINASGTVTGVRVLEHRETPGLGDKIDISVSDWILGFNDKSLDDPPPSRWAVVKDGGEFDQLVGATITARAVINGVRNALTFFQLNRSQLATAGETDQ